MCVAKPKLLGIDYAAKAALVVEDWGRLAKPGTDDEKRLARAKVKSLATFELRGRINPLTAGDPVAKDCRPRDLVRDYGADIPNPFRVELADRRGYYSFIGEPCGARIWVLYLWDHRTYSKQSGYSNR